MAQSTSALEGIVDQGLADALALAAWMDSQWTQEKSRLSGRIKGNRPVSYGSDQVGSAPSGAAEIVHRRPDPIAIRCFQGPIGAEGPIKQTVDGGAIGRSFRFE
ncbi:MAG: hypothetical protein AAGF58_16715 [Pseudomonadota bacterium]